MTFVDTHFILNFYSGGRIPEAAQTRGGSRRGSRGGGGGVAGTGAVTGTGAVVGGHSDVGSISSIC